MSEPQVNTVNVCDPGRAAYEAFCTFVAERNDGLESKPWDELPRVIQLGWYAAAQAAMSHYWIVTEPLREIPGE